MAFSTDDFADRSAGANAYNLRAWRAQEAADKVRAEYQIPFRPMNDVVIVRAKKPETKTASGIILTSEEPPTEGRVVAVGPGTMLQSGVVQRVQVRPGQWIRFGRWVAENKQFFRHAGEDFMMMKEGDVLGEIINESVDVEALAQKAADDILHTKVTYNPPTGRHVDRGDTGVDTPAKS